MARSFRDAVRAPVGPDDKPVTDGGTSTDPAAVDESAQQPEDGADDPPADGDAEAEGTEPAANGDSESVDGTGKAERADGDESDATEADVSSADTGTIGERLAELDGGETLTELGAPHVDDPIGVAPETVEDTVETYRAAGIDAGTFVDSNRVAATGLVAVAFDELRGRVDPATHDDLDAVQAQLTAGLTDVFDSVGTGVTAYETTGRGTDSDADGVEGADSGADGAEGDTADAVVDGTDESEPTAAAENSGRIQSALGVSAEAVLDTVGIPLFVTDADGNAVVWNSSIEDLTGVSAREAREKAMLSQAFYHDGRRAKTLADKVLDAPRNADTAYGVDRVAGVDDALYRDESVMTDAGGTDRNIDFRAAPVFDGDDVVGVVELIYDRTEDVHRQTELTTLVEHLTETMAALAEGQLDARADPDVDRSVVDDELLGVVTPLNELAERFERLAERVDEQTAQLAAAIDESSMAAGTVEATVGTQRGQLESAAREIQAVSASMQEIAATSDEVATSAQQAREAADHGQQASSEVHAVTDDLIDRSDALVESVEGLDERMDDIEEIVEVIGDVAEQTNMLALNANIEAARAGEAGAGFAVVADEVKSLAEETSQYTDEISANITELQARTAETVTAVEESHARIDVAEDRLSESLDALDAISEAVEEAAAGITEVADANDDQAATIEGITTTIEEAHEHASEAEAAVDDIVAATNRQTQVVQELYGTVDELIDRT